MSGSSNGSQTYSLNNFFRALSDRITKENAMSDILSAALHSSENVQKALGKVIGRDFPDQFTITREFYDRESGLRPDFAISFPQAKPFLIEVKILDKNYHFKEYANTPINHQKPDKILISAHKPKVTHPQWKIILWSDFINKLEEMDDDISKALAIYLRRVTMSEKIKAIRFNSPMGMLYLNRALKETITANQGSNYTCHLYPNRTGFGENCSGHYYTLKGNATGKDIAWPYFGIYYWEDAGDEYFWICISLLKERDWQSVDEKKYKSVAKALKKKYGKNFEDLEAEGIIWMDENGYNKFLKENKEHQQARLKKFFSDANSIIYKKVCGK
jgi:hypothetical protein